MKLPVFILAAFCFVSMAAGSASATVVSYFYQGLPLLLPDNQLEDAAEGGLPTVLPAHSGVMVIREGALPGGSLVNATVTFDADLEVPDSFDPVFSYSPDTEGLISFTVFPFPATAGAFFSFTTDADRRITSWFGSYLDGGPDGSISSTFGDSVDTDGFTYSAAPGTWSAPTIVPLPATGALLAAALASLVLGGGRRLTG